MTTNNIPSLEKKIFLAALVFIMVQLGFIAYSVYKLGIRVPTCATLKPYTKAEIITLAPDRYEIHLLARMWEFEPSHIQVPKGSVVDFFITSEDVTHGFYIDGTNINLMVVPNVVNYAQARFDKPGKYNIICHEYCGINHAQMHAVIEVTESTATARLP